MKKAITFPLLLLILMSSVVSAKGVSSKKVKAIKANQIVSLDGLLKEPIWEQQPITNFIQRDPDEGKPATEKTEVWIAYDDENLYIAARLYDSEPGKIDASLARRDSWIDSDWFFFYVDPYHDGKTGYFFGVNPGGSIIDGTYFNDSWNDDSWDGIWQSNTKIEDDGWSVELKIPFNQLRFNASDSMTWGINFHRSIKRKNEEDYFIMVPKEESGFVSHFAEMNGLEGIKTDQRIEILPYVVQKAQFLVHDREDPFYKGNQFKTNLGADFKIGIGSNLNLDGTINPDFGQVEVDPAVVNLSAFETYFPEKRPFFIEGQNIFNYGIGGANNNWGFNFGWPELFYSRRIGSAPHGSTSDADYTDYPNETRILGAAKLTGKLDETWSLGAVSAITERAYATLSTNGIKSEEVVEPLTHYGVLRTKKEFNDGKQALGIMATVVNRDLNTSSLRDNFAQNALTVGLDGWTFLDKDEDYVLTGAASYSYTNGTKHYITRLQEEPYRYFQRPDAAYMQIDTTLPSLSGWYTRFMLNKQRGNFYVNASLGAISPGFEFNDLGFQWMADRINGHLVMGYRWYEPDKIFRRKQIYLAHARSYNFEGKNISNFFWLRGFFTLLNYYGFGFNATASPEVYSPTWTRGGPIIKKPAEYSVYLNANSDNRQKLIVNLDGTYAWDDIKGVFYNIGLNFVWKPNTQISLSFGPSYSRNDEKRQWVDNIEDASAVETFGSRYLFARILHRTLSANIRLNWTFTPTLSLQLFLQPLVSVGKYSNFKQLAEPGADQFRTYDKNDVSYDAENEEYTIDPDGSGPADSFTIDNPDFNFKSLRGNLVLRYEVLPGSIFYFVWSHDQTNFDHPGDLSFGRDFRNLWQSAGNDVFLVKFSYWFDI